MRENKGLKASQNEERQMRRRDEENGLDFFHPFGSFFDESFLPIANESRNILKTDIKDEGGDYRLSVEVPGVDKKDVEVHLKNGYLTVSATLNRQSEEGKGKNVRRERFSGRYTRSFFVGENVDKKGVTASTQNGVLTIVVPKVKEADDRNDAIEVK